MDVKTKNVIWSGIPIRGIKSYQDLCLTASGLVLGIAEREIFFVFDPKTKRIVRKIHLGEKFNGRIPVSQGQRVFVKSPDGDIYLLLTNGIVQVHPNTFKLDFIAKAPTEITAGGAYLDGRIYFVGADRTTLYSYRALKDD